MTDLERALAAGAVEMTDLDRAVAAGAQEVNEPPALPAKGAPRQRYNMPAPPADDVQLEANDTDVNKSLLRSMQNSPMYRSAEQKGARFGRDVTSLATHAGDYLDAASFGAYRPLRDAAGGLVSPAAVAEAQGSEEKVHQDEPFVTGIARGLGYLENAPSLLAEGTSAAVRGVSQAAPKIVREVLTSRPVAGLITGGAVPTVQTATENAVAGRPLDENVSQAALIGATLGFGGGAIGATGSKIANKLGKNPDRLLIEKHGGRVTPSSPATGGAFETPLIKQGIDESGNVTDAGIGKVARQSAKNVRQSLNDEYADAGVAHGKAIEKIDASGATGEYHDFSDLANEAQRMADDVKRYTGDTRAKIKAEILPVIEEYASDGSYLASAKDINILRQKIQKVANFQTPTGVVKDKDIARLGRMAKKIVDRTAYAEPNAAYAERSDSLRSAHRALNIPGKSVSHTAPNDTSAEKTLTDVITRRGQNTVTAGKYDTPELEQTIAERPDLAVPMDSAALLRARSRMQFTGRGKAGGLIERTAEGGAHAGRPLDELRKWLIQNAKVIEQRFVQPGAAAASRLAPPPAALNLPQAVLRARRQKETRP